MEHLLRDSPPAEIPINLTFTDLNLEREARRAFANGTRALQLIAESQFQMQFPNLASSQTRESTSTDYSEAPTSLEGQVSYDVAAAIGYRPQENRSQVTIHGVSTASHEVVSQDDVTQETGSSSHEETFFYQQALNRERRASDASREYAMEARMRTFKFPNPPSNSNTR
jgi:hypothetical protein